MKLVIQRVKNAKVEVDGKLVSEIGSGLVILLGIGADDDRSQMDWLVNKVMGLRIFEDDAGKMNRCLLDISGEILLVSQFTLYADCRKGRRPGFSEAALPDKAEKLYEEFADSLKSKGVAVKKGIFGAYMQVSLMNDGPVTIILER
ncbi:MAG: D-tyrosyl-tRNA(Tyr) deacylase [Candidatus Cloacimonas sp. SDB]|nr:MAG: D-tyrosyl-tRNA(Tyr) deacylase [Candidatus Cloacimonas sp. SDB]